MNNKRAQYFLGIDLPKKESKFFFNLRISLENRSELSSPPHITLIPPFTLPTNISEKDFIAYFQNFSFYSFNIHLNKLDVFKHPHHLVFVLRGSKGTKSVLKNLHSSLKDYLSLYFPKKFFDYLKTPYKEHLTLANRVPIDMQESFYSKLSDLNLDLKFKAKGITVFKRILDNKWFEYSKKLFML